MSGGKERAKEQGSKVSLAVLVSKPEAVHLLQRLYRLCPHMAPGKAAPAAAAAAAAAPAAEAAAAAAE